MAGGKITRIVGGTNSIECETWTVYTDNFTAYAGNGSYFTAAGGTNFGDPKEPPPVGNYFVKGWWTDENDTPIKEAKILNTVRFHIQTRNIEKPEGKSILISLYEFDGEFLIPLLGGNFFRYKTDDPIEITSDSKKINSLTLDDNGKTYIEINLSWGLNNLFNDEFENGELELYFECSYEDQKVKLPDSFGDYLKVKRSDQNLFIQPFSEENKYYLPEIFNHTGDMILFAVNQENIEHKKFAAIKIKTTTTFSSLSSVNKMKKEILTEGVDFSSGAKNFKNFHIEEVEHFYRTSKPIKMVYIEETLKTIQLNQSYKGIISYGRINKIFKFGRDASAVYGSYQLLEEMREMIPELSANGEFNKPALSTFVGMLPIPEVFKFAFAVMEWISMDIVKEFNDMYDEMLQVKLENSKRSGLKYVKNLLHFGRENDYKNYRFVENVPQITVDKLLKGKIKSFLDLERKTMEDVNYVQNNIQKGIEVELILYSIIIKTQRDESIKDDIYIVESIIIQP